MDLEATLQKCLQIKKTASSIKRRQPFVTEAQRHEKIPRHGREDPFKTCTLHAGGSLPCRFSASNIQHRSKPGREACDPQHEGSVPYNRCGFKRAKHEPGRGEMRKSVLFILIFVIEDFFHKFFVDLIKQGRIIHIGEKLFAV